MMAAPTNTPEEMDLLPNADDWAVADNDYEGDWTDAEVEHFAATKIQAARRGKSARRDLVRLGSPERAAASTVFTPELAKSHAHSLAPTADGRSWALTRLSASGLRLAGSLSNGLVQLPHLTTIDLSDNRLLTLEGLEALPRLSSLICCGTRLQGVRSIPARHDTRAPRPRPSKKRK
jgi:Leucine-rich repeat (LRR) protein